LASVSSDLRGYYTFQYHYTSEHHEYHRLYAEFERQLHEKISYIFENLNPSDNPVSDFLGHPNDYLRQHFDQERDELVLLAGLFRDVVMHNYELCETILKLAETGKHPEDGPALIFDFFPFDLLLSRLVNTRWRLMPMQTIQKFNEAVQEIRRMFLPVHQVWHILRINPTSEANVDFLDLVRAVIASRRENEKELLEAVVDGVEKTDFSISFTPRAETIRKRKRGAKKSCD
jgi:hypothetical protein